MVSYCNRASGYIWPNRAADPTKANILEETFPFFSNLWSGSREQNWYLDMLATHPDFEGQGLGSELVTWGIEEASKENVCASVISALGKEGFYGRFGFIEIGRSNVGRLRENGIQGGAVMFREVRPAQRVEV
jgi:predicted N-acetyltransferase YhbS